MAVRTKRTYNLSPDAVATVKDLVERHGLASSQDALVEQAIAELARRVRDVEDARLWARAAEDPLFHEEVQVLDELFDPNTELWDE